MKISLWIYEAKDSPYCETYFLPLCNSSPDYVEDIRLFRISRVDKGFVVNKEEHGRVHLIQVYFSLREILRLLKFMYSELSSLRSEKYVISVRSIHSAGLFLILNAFRKEKIVLWYDSDGLAADERLQNSKKDISTFFIYFISRLIERRIVREAERILVRSCETKEILAARANLINADKIFIELENGIVIPELKVSSDYASFLREKLGLTDDFFVAVYLGSIGPQYCIEDVKDCVRTIKQLMDRVCFLVISNEDTGIAYKYFNGLEREGVRLRYLSGLNHGLVHDYLAGCDLGISFRADQMSMHHVKPLKNRNYLAAGIPLVYSVITGDKDKFPKDSCFPIVGDFKSSIASFSNWLIGSLEFRKELGRSSRRYAEQNCDIVNDAFLYFKLPTKK